jgi:hypothetical protein
MKYLHIIEQCNTDIRQGNIIVISSVDDTRHSHSQNSTFFLKSGDTVNAQLHNATLPPPLRSVSKQLKLKILKFN